MRLVNTREGESETGLHPVHEGTYVKIGGYVAVSRARPPDGRTFGPHRRWELTSGRPRSQFQPLQPDLPPLRVPMADVCFEIGFGGFKARPACLRKNPSLIWQERVRRELDSAEMPRGGVACAAGFCAEVCRGARRPFGSKSIPAACNARGNAKSRTREARACLRCRERGVALTCVWIRPCTSPLDSRQPIHSCPRLPNERLVHGLSRDEIARKPPSMTARTGLCAGSALHKFSRTSTVHMQIRPIASRAGCMGYPMACHPRAVQARERGNGRGGRSALGKLRTGGGQPLALADAPRKHKRGNRRIRPPLFAYERWCGREELNLHGVAPTWT